MIDFNMISPIEEYGGVLFKRDDKFKPFNDIELNGSKLRQMFSLINNNLEKIKSEHNGTVITYSSVLSPQSLITARVAKHFDLNSKILIGVNTNDLDKTIETHSFLKQAKSFGAEIVNVAKIGYNTVLYKRLLEYNINKNYFIIKFGIEGKLESHVIEPLTKQVENIPEDIDNLIIPVGSAICTKGILQGLIERNLKPNIFCVQISGYDRSKVINIFIQKKYKSFEFLKTIEKKYINFHFKEIDYNFAIYKKHPYNRLLKININENEYLDQRYEAKAFDWYLDNKDLFSGKTLFFIIGNNCKG